MHAAPDVSVTVLVGQLNIPWSVSFCVKLPPGQYLLVPGHAEHCVAFAGKYCPGVQVTAPADIGNNTKDSNKIL